MSDDAQGTGTPTTTPGEQQPTTGAESSQTNETSTAGTPAPTTSPEATEVDIEFDLPEGVALDEQGVTEFKALAKELKLPAESAKKLADLAATRARAQHEAHAALVTGWAEQVKTDKDIGGDKLAENLAVAKKAIDQFGSPELKDLLNSTGLGNHPEVVKLAWRIGKAISEDGFVRGQPKGAATESDLAKSLFPSMNR